MERICLQSHFLFPFYFFLFLFANCVKTDSIAHIHEVYDFHVGVVLDMDSEVGKVGWNCIELALTDFYAIHPNYKTRLFLTSRDSKGDNVQASLAVVDLLQNVEVQAIIGPQTSRQVDLVLDHGDKAHVPIISFSAASPSLSLQTPYFVRAAASDSSQVMAITAIIRSFKWREVVPVYENSDFGRGIIPFFIDALQVEQVKVPYKSAIPLSATNDKIRVKLYKLMKMPCRVFIVHMSPIIASRFFLLAKELRMSEGYVWIVTDGVMNFLESMGSTILASMQGVLGVKPYVRRTHELKFFTKRWRKKFHQDLNIYGLWAYDTIWTLAKAAERVGPTKPLLENPATKDKLVNLTNFTTSRTGPELLQVLTKNRFTGLSGDIAFVNGQLKTDIYDIINVNEKAVRNVGFWTSEHGILDKLNRRNASVTSLRGIIWPGGLHHVPKGWVIPGTGEKLRVGVPMRAGFDDFVKFSPDPYTNKTNFSGFSIEVFRLVIKALPYPVAYEFEPFINQDGSSAGTNSDLIDQLHKQNYDVVVGDTTITRDRSLNADFTLPYVEGGVSMMVPVKHDRTGSWIFLKPLTKDLWLISGAFFILTGIVIWALEHRVNEAFRGPPSQHVPLILWFPLSTFVYAHRERIVSNLTRFVVIVWIFVVFILNSSYTASLSSILTVQRLQPTVTGIQELIKSGDYVGYQTGSFIHDLLKNMSFDESRLKPFLHPEDMDIALQKGSPNGGIAALFSVVPTIKLFISRYCNRYTMVGPISKTEGFGIAFPKGSPLVADVSRAILETFENGNMKKLEQPLFGSPASCTEPKSSVISNGLNFDSFRWLFLITGTVSGFALLVFLTLFLYKNKGVMTTGTANPNKAIWTKFKTILKQFDERDLSSYRFRSKRSVEGRDMRDSPCSTSVSELRDIEASPSFSNVSNVRYMEASPSSTSSPCLGMRLIHVDDITFNSIMLEELEDVRLSD